MVLPEHPATPADVTSPLFVRKARDTDAKAVVALLSLDHHLEVAFDPREFSVAEAEGRVVACARVKPLGPGEAELASVVVDPAFRGQGHGARLVEAALREAPAPVYALALAPGFFHAQGFRPLAAVPPPLVGKATSVCASSGFVPMRRATPTRA